MTSLFTKEWWSAAITRAIKTMAQTFVAVIGSSAVLSEIDWKIVLSSMVVAGLLSLATSLSGLPEVNTDGTITEENTEE